MAKVQKDLLLRHQAERIKNTEWRKHLAITNNRIYRLDTMTDVTGQKTIQIDGYEYNLRKIAFFVIHGRWPARNFLLPWE
jgi:hypothetical protein